jgi:hypothetical protein
MDTWQDPYLVDVQVDPLQIIISSCVCMDFSAVHCLCVHFNLIVIGQFPMTCAPHSYPGNSIFFYDMQNRQTASVMNGLLTDVSHGCQAQLVLSRITCISVAPKLMTVLKRRMYFRYTISDMSQDMLLSLAQICHHTLLPLHNFASKYFNVPLSSTTHDHISSYGEGACPLVTCMMLDLSFSTTTSTTTTRPTRRRTSQ